MANVWTFGPSGSVISFLDATKYRVPVRTANTKPIYDVDWNAVRNSTGINLGLDDHTADEISFQVFVTGTGWQAVLDNYAAIESRLVLASAFSRFGSGTVVQYIRQAGDQSSPTTRAVVRGTLEPVDSLESVKLLRKVGVLTLLCEP